MNKVIVYGYDYCLWLLTIALGYGYSFQLCILVMVITYWLSIILRFDF
jgi:hypothetical protein